MEFNLIGIQKTIGYDFSNPDLLKQAFIRRSYAEENGGPDYQVLEFIGDRALDLAIIRLFTLYYGEIKEVDGFNGYYLKRKEFIKSKFNEGDFSAIKQELVEGKHLSRCITNLGIHNYLIMGTGETINNDKAKEDLFEAIIGAVALDCDWDIPTLCYVVDVMMDVKSYAFKKDVDEDKYLLIIQEWSLENKYGLPLYSYNYLGHGDFECVITFTKNEDLKFVGKGNDEPSSRRMAAKNAYYDLVEKGKIINPYRQIVGEPTWEKSLEQINILVTKKMIDNPTFKCSSSYDSNGNELWTCTITNNGCDREFTVYNAPSKIEARKECAFEYLRYIMDEIDADY